MGFYLANSNGSIATAKKAGLVKPDGVTLEVSKDGTLSVIDCPKTGVVLDNIPSNIVGAMWYEDGEEIISEEMEELA